MVLAGIPFVPETKSPGDLIESAEWNAATEEIKRLEVDKLNRKGADTLQGPLTIEQALRVGNVSAATLATLPNGSRLTVANSSTDLLNVRFQQGGGELEFVNWTSGWNINTKTAGKHLCLNRDASETSNVYVGRANNDICVKGNGNVGLCVDPTARLDITGVGDTAGQISLQLRSGNSGSDYRSSQVTFGYNKLDKYRHVIKTRHNGGSKSGNAIDFYVWKYIDQTNKDAPETIGTLHTMTLDGGNVGIGTTSPQAKLQVIDASTTAGSGTTFVLGPTTASHLRLGYHQDYSWIQSHGNKPLAINPAGNNVGIGTTSPKEKLQVSGGKMQLDGDQQLVFTDSGTSNNLKLQLWSGYGLGINSSTLFYTAAGRHSWRDNSSVERMALTTTANGGLTVNGTGNSSFAGNLGIGTTTPSAKLHVDGNAVVSNGNVGIGTTSPKGKLHVLGDLALGDDQNNKKFIIHSRVGSGGDHLQITHDKSDGNWNWGQGIILTRAKPQSETTATVETRVGIGTEDPRAKLHVNGTGGSNTEVLRVANSSTDFMNVQSSSTTGGGQLQFIAWSSGWNINTKTKDKHLYLNRDADSTSNVYIGRANNDICVKGSNGNVGLAVDPTEKLHVNGNALISGNIKATSLTVSTGNAIITTSAGNVGIGTNDPKAKLHVIGTGGSNVDLIVNGRLKSDSDDGGLWVKDDRFVGGHEKNQIGFYNGGAWRLSVLNNGNVGIGTTNPRSSLEIRKDGGSTKLGPVLTLSSHSGGTGAGGAIDFNGYDVGTNAPSARIQSLDDGNASSHLTFSTKKSGASANSLEERLRIQANGNVGIGTTDPKARLDIATQARTNTHPTDRILYVTGAIEAEGKGVEFRKSDASEGIGFGCNTIYAAGSNNTQDLNLKAKGTGKVKVTSSLETNSLTVIGTGNAIVNNGKMGIGIASPDAKLHIINQSTDTSGKTLILGSTEVNQTYLSLGYNTNYGWIQSFNSKPLALNAAGNNVGIGTTNPSERLEVNGSLKILGSRIKSKDGYGIVATDQTDWLRINPDGSYPGTAFYKAVALGSGGGLVVGEWSQQGEGVLKVTKSSYLATTSGNVGIGTTDPQAKLHVNGAGGTTVEMIVNGRMRSSGTHPGLFIGDDKRFIGGEAAGKVGFYNEGWHFTVLNNGNVGIGTESPQAKLHVNGRIRDKNGWLMPVGSILPYAASNAPDGWLLCNGDPLNKKNNPIYQELFDVIGYQYGGSGDIFNLPDLRGRVPVGLNNRSGEEHFQRLGNQGGSKDHKLTMAEMPAHRHNFYDPGHSHELTCTDSGGTGYIDDAGGGTRKNPTQTGRITTGITLETQGSDRPHNNLQPYTTVNYIIKY